METCDFCKQEIVIQSNAAYSFIYTGYIWLGDKKCCWSCHAPERERNMIKHGSINLEYDSGHNMLIDHHSELHFLVRYTKLNHSSAWGNIHNAVSLRFVGPDGKVWQGRISNTDWGNSYVRCYRSERKLKDIMKP